MLSELQEDIDRYIALEKKSWWFHLLTRQGVWVITQYRFSRWVKLYFHIPILRQILRAFCFFWGKVMEVLTNCEVSNGAKIGKGLLLAHASCITIHEEALIGEHCNISQEVTIGLGGRRAKRGAPHLGNHVLVGPGARVFGKITVGNNVAIGANAVVTKDLPAEAVAVGIPAKVISYNGSQDFIFCYCRDDIRENELDSV